MKVTIVIPYKEDRGFLNEAVESVEKQTYKC
jgi:glycosyltransferase involved in cell wall biosynthesis